MPTTPILIKSNILMSFTITRHNSLPYCYKNHCYQIHKPKHGGHIKGVLDRIFNSIEAMLSHYAKVFVVRIDLHPKGFSPDNSIMSQFLKSYIPKLERQYKCKVSYLCAREQGTESPKQHYHLALMFSGHKINHPENLLKQLKSTWEDSNAGTAAYLSDSYYMMFRGVKSSIDSVIYRLSYLAKQDTKERNRPANHLLRNTIKLNGSYQDESNHDGLLVDPFITHRDHQQAQTKAEYVTQ